MLSSVALAFVEGLGLIASPCILPILPIILATGIEGTRKKAFGIVAGFIIFFTLVTLFSRKLIALTGMDPELLPQVAAILLVILGVILISDKLSEWFNQSTQTLASFADATLNTYEKKGTGFLNGLAIGLLIALIWTPCAGPILSAAIVQIAIQKTTYETFWVLLSFGLGVAIPLSLLILLGRKILDSFSILKAQSVLIRKLVGILIIIGALASAWDSFFSDFSFFSKTHASTSNGDETPMIINALATPYDAPDFVDISNWINASPLKMSELKGKVILVDFWTYSCINCVRTLPHITQWHEKYKNKGLVIVGVHSPEFPFEAKLNNVKAAVAKHNILYPVALDNKLATWQNFNNRYWPAHYLINKEGKVVYTHFGEGAYDVTEKNIQALLGSDASELSVKIEEAGGFSGHQTPETYLGFERTERFSSSPTLTEIQTTYELPPKLDQDHWGISGLWQSQKDATVNKEAHTVLRLNFEAKTVFLVLSNRSNHPIRAKISLNGKELGSYAGKDVHDGYIVISQDTLYELVRQDKPAPGLLEITFEEPGVGIHAFTFGN